MKKLLVVCVLMLTVTVLIAQSDDAAVEVRAGGSYILKSTDGSGKVPLYEKESDKPALYIDEGRVVRSFQLSNGKDRFNFEYEYNKYYWVDVANAGEETAGSIASRLYQEQKSIFENPFFAILLIIIAMILVHAGNKIYTKTILKKYYDEKLEKFEWFRNWVKNNPLYISSRTRIHAGFGLFVIQVVFWGGFLLVYLFSEFILGGIFGVHIGNDTPVAMFSIYGGLLLIGELCAIKAIGNPKTSMDRKYGGTLECPYCGCPHSWGMLFHHNIVSDSKTITTTTWEGDDKHVIYRKNIWGEWKSTLKTRVDKYFYGTVIQDFQCANCNQKKHFEFGETWTNSKPDTNPKTFNPPEYVAEPDKEIRHWYSFFTEFIEDFFADGENVRNLIMTTVCAFLTMYFWKWILYVALEDAFMNEMTFSSRMIMYAVATAIFCVINGFGWWAEVYFIRVVSIIFSVVGLTFLVLNPSSDDSQYFMLPNLKVIYPQKETVLYTQADENSPSVDKVDLNSKMKPTGEIRGEWVGVIYEGKVVWIKSPKLSKQLSKRWIDEW